MAVTRPARIVVWFLVIVSLMLAHSCVPSAMKKSDEKKMSMTISSGKRSTRRSKRSNIEIFTKSAEEVAIWEKFIKSPRS